jgi:hypothetical protein
LAAASLQEVAEKVDFLLQSKRGWTNSTVAKAFRMKKIARVCHAALGHPSV